MLQLSAQAGENVIASLPVPTPSLWHHPFRFGYIVTPEAVYIPGQRSGFHLREDLEQRRIPLRDITEISLTRASPLAGLAVMNLLVIAMWFFACSSEIRQHGLRLQHFGLPFILLPGTIRTSLGAPGRLCLSIRTTADIHHVLANPFHLVSRSSKRAAIAAQVAFARACADLGVKCTGLDEYTTPEGHA